ncbi:MAG: hypothetical protein JOZ62_19360, partial [Acidobacteriaceae bacterium]|nr:hypothetical protein [Acidobacteriaceae bacterium]
MPTHEDLKKYPRIAVRVASKEEEEEARRVFAQLEGNEIHDEYQDVITGYASPEIYNALL